MLRIQYCFIKWTLVLAAFFVCWIANGSAQARMELDITGPGFQRIPIAIPNFKYQSSEQPQLAREMGEALATDRKSVV